MWFVSTAARRFGLVTLTLLLSTKRVVGLERGTDTTCGTYLACPHNLDQSFRRIESRPQPLVVGPQSPDLYLLVDGQISRLLVMSLQCAPVSQELGDTLAEQVKGRATVTCH